MRTFLIAIILTLLGTLPSTSTFADEPITPKTFSKFSELAGFERQYNQMITIFVSNFQQGMIAGFQNGISKKEIPDHVKKKLYPIVNQSAENLKSNFENLFRTAVKFDDLVNNVYFPVYRKNFTEEEIKEIIKFYSTPVGKKVSQLTPSIMQESSEVFNKLYGARVQELGGDLVKKSWMVWWLN